MDKVKQFFRKLTSQFYPDKCPFCSSLIDDDKCCCDNCKKHLPQYNLYQGVKGGYRCVSPLPYKGKYKRAVHRFKFGAKVRFSSRFATLMAKSISQQFEDMIFDYITYVPMHKKALKKRGYNQSELLAKELSKIMGIPYVNTLNKIKETKPQHHLTAKNRKTNLKGAFEVSDKDFVKNKSILIIDDIITTGYTLGECCKTLQKAKPLSICCATFLATGYLY